MSTTTIPTSPGEQSEEPSRRQRRSGGPGSAKSRPVETVAAVNLLSPWVFEEIKVHQLRRRLVVIGIVLVAVVALVWGALRFNLHQAEEELRGEEATGTGLSSQLAQLTPVKTYVDSVDRRVLTVRGATYDDVEFSRVLEALDAAAPDGVQVATISVELASTEADGTTSTSTTSSESTTTSDAAGSAEGDAEGDQDGKGDKDPARGLVGSTCPGPDPFGTKVVVGCVTFEGTAVSRDAVGQLVIALGDEGLFVEPFVDTTTTDAADAAASAGGPVSFTGSVGLSPKVFSGRYDGLGDELTKGAKK